jgi:quinol-cytochrome oxidoreductase complex cytochrome b subunit
MTIRIVAIVLGVLALAGTIVLAVAGASSPHSNAMGPLAFLACIVAVVVMILLGVTFGGRNNPRRAPQRFADPLGSTGATTDPATGERDETAEAP